MDALLIPVEQLPDRPSYLIRQALLDISECSRDFRYRIEGNVNSRWHDDDYWDHAWHRMNITGNTCIVCMAGAVMAKSLYAAWGEEYVPGDFEPDTEKKLMALDAFRTGAIHTALVHILGYQSNPLEVERRITPYAQSRKLFFRQMNMLADDLESHAL